MKITLIPQLRYYKYYLGLSRFVGQGIELTVGQRGRCFAGSGGKTLPPRGRRKQKTTQGCDGAPRSPDTHRIIRL